jgi:hypothetical protein
MTAHSAAEAMADQTWAEFQSELDRVIEAGRRLADATAANPEHLDLSALGGLADALLAAGITGSFCVAMTEEARRTDQQVVRIRELLDALPPLPEPNRHLEVVG